MNKKVVILRLLFGLFVCLFYTQEVWSASFTDFAYNLARKGRVKELKSYLVKGYSINTVRPDGMTALCIAVAKNDYSAYEKLRQLGANPKPQCMNRIDVRKSNAFARKYGYSSGELVKPQGEDKTALYTGLGVVAVGGVAALALSDSDSGSKGGSSRDEGEKEKEKGPCGGGSVLVDGECVCMPGYYFEDMVCKEIVCPSNSSYNIDIDGCKCNYGYRDEGGVCEEIICPTNASLNEAGDGCKCNYGYRDDGGECVEVVCPTNASLNEAGDGCKCNYGYREEGGECVEVVCPTNASLNEAGDGCKCNYGYRDDGGECKIVECPENASLNEAGDGCQCNIGYREKDGVCEAIVCPPNTQLVGDTCVALDVDIQNTNDNDVYGIKSPEEDVYNLYSVYVHQDDRADIKIENQGNGNVYGMYGYGNVINAFVDGYRYASLGEYNSKSNATGSIVIRNSGTGNVYGIYSRISNITEYKQAMNAISYDGAIATGIIDIVNGTGDTYGVFGDVRAYNAFDSASTGESYGIINLKGNGNIYGIYGYVAATNASAALWSAASVDGKVNIKSLGDGNVYGIKISKDTIPGAGGTAASWFAFNAYADGAGKAKGLIDIENFGNGNVYGMQGGEQLYNAYVDNNTQVYGAINIKNYGNGNVYGMYVDEPYEGADGEFRPIVSNQNSEFGSSVITLANTGNGVVTGLRGGVGNIIVNSGGIDINNLGSGTAVGIYAEKDASVVNSGSITIHRDAIYDSNGTQHNPTSTTGGKAYGIYAESGASVNNDGGTIVISGADSGAGIYLESGATLVNNGTISVNVALSKIVENGSALDIYGDRAERTSYLDTTSLGAGDVYLGKNGQFFADTIAGKMGVVNDVVMGNFDNNSTVSKALMTDNADDLSLYSQSVMYDAHKKLAQDGVGYDVVLSRKNFADLLKDDNIALYLENNYNLNNGQEIYDYLKQAKSIAELESQTADVTGGNIMPNFRYEDAIVYRSLNRQFSDNLFNKPNENYIGGYKYVDISSDKDGSIMGSDGVAHVAYGMLKGKVSNGMTLGVGATIYQLDSDYDNGSSRKSNNFGLWVPMGADVGENTKWFSKFYVGYGDNSYKRKSGLGRFEADFDEYRYGLSNEVRHKIEIGTGFWFEPLAELNLLGAFRDGFNEGDVIGAIKADSDDYLSLEGGIGAYLSKQFMFDEDSKLGIQIGGIYYVEFLDPDDGKYNINGLSGKYRLISKSEHGRGVFSLRANYNYKNVNIYAGVEKETGKNDAVTVDAGMQYKF